MTGSLDGVRIVDLSQMIAAPYCTQVLADLGADVIKVEDPSTAVNRRVGFSPPTTDAQGNPATFSTYWLASNRNKRSLTLDLKSARAREVLGDLVRVSDVVIENYSEHTRRALGVDEEWGRRYRADLIWASLTGFGRTGPEASREGFDFLAQARGGFLSLNGEPDGLPLRSANSMVDYLAGLHLGMGILAALRHRDRTGEGQLVDVSLLDTVITALDGFPLWHSVAGVVPPRTGNMHPMRLPGYRVYACADGHVAIAAVGPSWERFKALIGSPELEGEPLIEDGDAYIRYTDRAMELVAEFMAARTVDEARAVLDERRIPNEPIRDLSEIWDDPQLRARGMFVPIDYAPLGRTVETLGNPIHLSRTPAELRRLPPGPGEHTWEVLTDLLGYDDETVAELAIEGVTEYHGEAKLWNQ